MKNLKVYLIIIFFLSSTLLAKTDDHDDHGHGDEHGAKNQKKEHKEEKGHDDHGHGDEHKEEKGHDDHGHGDEHEGEGLVKLTENEIKEFGIETDLVRPHSLNISLTFPGEVKVNEDRLAHIVPRFPGIVKDVAKTVGDFVHEGDVLATIESNESLTTYEMISLLEGTVIEKHATLGEVLSAEDTAFVVADLDTVWIDLRVYQNDMRYIKKGLTVHVTVGKGMPTYEGEIVYFSPTVDEHTRTGLARITLSNPNLTLKPGQFVSGEIQINKDLVPLAVPNTALQYVDGKVCVFAQTPEGFEARFIEIGRQDRSHSEIKGGLQNNEIIVVKNSFTLKADLGKSSFGDGHGH